LRPPGSAVRPCEVDAETDGYRFAGLRPNAEPVREADILTVHASELGTLGACHRCLALVDRRADDILLIVED
jgi:hypothetical protein